MSTYRDKRCLLCDAFYSHYDEHATSYELIAASNNGYSQENSKDSTPAIRSNKKLQQRKRGFDKCKNTQCQEMQESRRFTSANKSLIRYATSFHCAINSNDQETRCCAILSSQNPPRTRDANDYTNWSRKKDGKWARQKHTHFKRVHRQKIIGGSTNQCTQVI